MGLRFRKRIPLGRLVRLNLSKSGPSIGIGPPGANVNFGPRGKRLTLGIPGTGVSWVKTEGYGKGGAADPRRPAGPLLWFVGAAVLLVLILAVAG